MIVYQLNIAGSDGQAVQWECKANLNTKVRFGKVEVVCEGYDYPEDDFILAGSCGLEYSLELTKEGRSQEKYSGGGGGWFSNQKVRLNYSNNRWQCFNEIFSEQQL